MLRAFLGPALDLFITVQVAHHETVSPIRQLSLNGAIDSPTGSGMQRHCSAYRSEISPATDACSHLQSRANFEASGMESRGTLFFEPDRVNFAAYVPVFKCGSRLKPWKSYVVAEPPREHPILVCFVLIRPWLRVGY
jgi:hypothetical protein